MSDNEKKMLYGFHIKKEIFQKQKCPEINPNCKPIWTVKAFSGLKRFFLQ